MSEHVGDDDNELIKKTLSFQWKASNALSGNLELMSREMMSAFKNTVCSSWFFDPCNIELLSCNKCSMLFRPEHCSVRLNPKPVVTRKKIGKNTRKLDAKLHKKLKKKRSIVSATCKNCGFVSKSEGACKDEIEEIVCKRQAYLNALEKSKVKALTHKSQASQALQLGPKKIFQVGKASTNHKAVLNSLKSSSKKKKKRPDTLANILKSQDQKPKNSANSSLHDFLASLK